MILEPNRLRASGVGQGLPVLLHVSTRSPRPFVSGVAMSGQVHPVIDGMKVCNGCGKNKPVSEYHKYPSRKGVRSRCKECFNAASARYHHEHPEKRPASSTEYRHRKLEKYRATERLRYSKNSAKEAERKQRLWREHPEMNRAHCAVRDAIKKGEMVRPDRCSECGRQVEIEAHHEDYGKPLEVIWLCLDCHMKLHWGNKGYVI